MGEHSDPNLRTFFSNVPMVPRRLHINYTPDVMSSPHQLHIGFKCHVICTSLPHVSHKCDKIITPQIKGKP